MSMNVVRLSVVMGASAMLAVLAGCSKKEAAAPAAPEPAAKSILDLMHDPIASNADLLWNAVGTVSTETGTKDLAPSTDAEWAALRKQALAIAEAAKLLPMEGRVVAHPDQKLKDPPGEGDLTPAQAQAAIEKDRPAFAAFAVLLENSATAFVAAIDKKDLEAYATACGTLDEVCEACHTRYWYPNAPKPPGL